MYFAKDDSGILHKVRDDGSTRAVVADDPCYLAWLDRGGVLGEMPVVPGPTLTEVQSARIVEATAACDAVLAPLGAEYGVYEMATWDQQFLEAKAYTADPTADVPLLAAMCVARGVSIATLAARVIANRNAWVALTGNVIGQRQRIVDQISAAETVEAVMAVDMTITLPG